MPGVSATATGISQVIGLSIAPVFLLTAVSSILAVMTNRMARIIDRARALEGQIPTANADRAAVLESEVAVLASRARLVNRGIRLCTTSALLIAGVVTLLFIGALFQRDLAHLIGAMFVAAMVVLCTALVSLLHEITLATRHMRFGRR